MATLHAEVQGFGGADSRPDLVRKGVKPLLKKGNPESVCRDPGEGVHSCDGGVRRQTLACCVLGSCLFHRSPKGDPKRGIIPGNHLKMAFKSPMKSSSCSDHPLGDGDCF